VTAQQFNPVEAQQHIEPIRENRKAWERANPGSALETHIANLIARDVTKLVADLQSAVEYIADLEAKHHSGFNCSNRYEAVNRRMVTAEAQVARLKTEMSRAVRVEDSMTHQPFFVIVGRMIRILNDALAPASTEPEKEN
jgi:predicted  nucleic acid-binding Zn-ribbon protein